MPFRTFSLLNALRLRAGRLDVSASLPVVAQNGTAVSYIAGVPVPTGGPEAGTIRRRQPGQTIPVRPGRRDRLAGHGEGALLVASQTETDTITVAGTGAYEVNVGDPMFGAVLTAYEGVGTLRSFAVDGWVKAPVASVESGVGSGAWDYGVGTSIALGIGRGLLFASATWWALGDMPDLELEDALFYSLGAGLPLGRSWSLLASASASTRIIATSDPPASVGLFVSRRIGSAASIGLGASAGLSETATDLTASVSWSTRIGGARQ